MPKSAKRLAREIDEIWTTADREERELTHAERRDVEAKIEAAKAAKEIEDGIRQMDPGAPLLKRLGDGGWASGGGTGPGAVFVASSGYKSIKDPGARGQSWTSGAVDVGSFELRTKGTLFEGSGGTLVPPQYVPGVVSQLFTPIGLADYFKSSQTTSTQLRYVVEGTVVSGATGVAEGGVKPESTLGYNEQVEQVRKIATTLPISDELLDDAVSVQSYINGRLTLFLKLEEERQILRGSGGGSNQLTGIIGASGVNITTAGTSNADKIFRAAAGVRGSAFLDPDLLCIHPTNWVTSRLQQDAAGQYYGGGPWAGQYGAGPNVQASSFSSAPYWGLRVWVTPTVGAGTALIGNASQAAEIFRRGGVSIESTNAHSDFFVKDLSMIRAEERLALALYRPGAWVEVRGLA